MIEDDERRDSARALLRTPLVLAARDPEIHRAIRRHADFLIAMFRNYLGYRLVVDGRFARLFKAGLGPTGRPLNRPKTKVPFTPRDYTYLALLCSALLTTREQVLLSSVVADVRQAGAEAGIDVSDDTLTERRALVHALRLLVEWGVVVEDAGSVDDYAEDPTKEALLWVDREIVGNLLAIPLRDVDEPDDLVRLASVSGPDAVRHAVRRRLVESPVVMLDELSEPERLWLRQYQRREAQLIEQNFDLRLEIRAEGVATLDPREELTDLQFPREGTLGQAALLAVAGLVAELKPGEGSASVRVPAGLLASVVGELLDRYATRWSKEYVDHPERLAPDVEDLLVDIGLLDRRRVVGDEGLVAEGAGDSSSDGAADTGFVDAVFLRAVAARFAPEAVEIEAAERPLAFELEDA